MNWPTAHQTVLVEIALIIEQLKRIDATVSSHQRVNCCYHILANLANVYTYILNSENPEEAL